MDSRYLAHLGSRLESGFATVGKNVTVELPEFDWNADFFDHSATDSLVAHLTFVLRDHLDELVVITVVADRSTATKWSMDLVGPSLVVDDLRCKEERLRAAITADPEAAANAAMDFLARVSPVILQELAACLGRDGG
jgi:hypothetical protein